MPDFLNRRMSLRVLALAVAIPVLGCSPKIETGTVAATTPAAVPVAVTGPLKIGFVYVGPVGNAGWTYAHDLGRKAIEKEFGDKVKTTFVENVAEGADAERVFRDLAAQGNTLIFGTTFGYMEPMLKVAKDFPAVNFQHATGYKTAANMGVYDAHTYEGAYLAGVVAGKMTKSGKLGVVASIPIPEVIRNINAFTLGAQSSNPAISTRVVWINKWFDPGKEREGALALIGQGVDVLIQNTDSPATLQAAEEKGVHAFGWDSDMSKIGPKSHLASATIDWSPYYKKVVTEALAGSVKSADSWWGVKEGAIVMASINAALPADVRTLLEQKTAAISDGTLTPFQGPIMDQAGKEVVAAGQTMAIKDMKGLRYYVKGVDGAMPK
ncbi:BMP family ABC transporter substrate-binding protein [Actimicrobium sp. CCI2.3]|uniref:BMP family ABC transporter substrate-binding protein n=1 Tax=Actimicrobium sp. CCI2.3 TaxID=3048616 RepID=UPI002AB39580|nr:BMP family ABC transporter substrate-binding protein [Actimicrobium sp. CCI2.3]MDY7574314.1 BMP family ABC transporter substrate-binding protein [Actimicrobium sp. CCI2.3]MEB0023831.1 BMP family ABC transporter substrate-binding protein [Actimicrobium sp. CCI2.3]